MKTQTISLTAMKAVLFSARMRRVTNGRTALCAAYTDRPVARLDCHFGIGPFSGTVAKAAAAGVWGDQVGFIDRGYIAQVIQRVRRFHGLAEVKKTFKTGMRTLASEDQFLLFNAKKGGGS